MIKSIREWLLKCNYFNELKELGVDFLSSDSDFSSIEKSPGKKVIEERTNGDSVEQINIILRSWFKYSGDLKQNIENSEFYEKLSDWIDVQKENNNLPKLGTNKKCTDVEVSGSDYLVSISDNLRKACYQMQLKIEYIKENKDEFSEFYK